jgi:hypothetical protein
MTRPTLAAVFLCAMASVAWAGPPYQTDDPEPAETGRWELFLAAYAGAEAGGSLGGGPQLELNYGVAPDWQLSAAPQLSWSLPGGGGGTYGLGDTQLGVKYRFLHEGDRCPQAAFYPQVVLPSGDADRGLGAGRAQLFLPLWFQKSWGAWTNFGGGGYWFDRGAGQKDWVFIGDALQRDLGERFSVGGELFFHSAAQEDDADGLGANLAVLYHLGKDDHLVCSAGRDMGIGNTTFTGYLAYQKIL